MAEGAIDPGDDERVILAKKLEKRLQLDPPLFMLVFDSRMTRLESKEKRGHCHADGWRRYDGQDEKPCKCELTHFAAMEGEKPATAA